jgi:hypothetical protein
MVFIDGFGLGHEDPAQNPFITAKTPFLRKLLSGASLSASNVGNGIDGSDFIIRPTDASLGIPGLPQSATGQTTIFTGINASAVVGRHINGFPTYTLRKLIREASLFKAIYERGGKAVFANTFTKEYFESVQEGKWRHSVTTTSALAGNCQLFMPEDLLQRQSIYQDITNEKLRERGYDVPVWEPEDAGTILINQAVKNDFTLFEYFQTDHCGHHQDYSLALILLNRLDRFLETVAGSLGKNHLTLLVVSDHGNIEDLSMKTHTLNPVPTIAMGEGAMEFKEIHSLMDIYPTVIKFLGFQG